MSTSVTVCVGYALVQQRFCLEKALFLSKQLGRVIDFRLEILTSGNRGSLERRGGLREGEGVG